MAFTSFSYTDNGDQITKDGYASYYGKVIVKAGKTNLAYRANLDPLKTEGFNTIGNPISIPDFSKTRENIMVKKGSPSVHVRTLPISEQGEMTFTFDHPRMLAFLLMQANDLNFTYNVAADGQTTVASGGTKTSAVLTSETGIAIGDCIYVDLTDGTYGGFPEITYITATNGTTVEFEPLSRAPADAAAFLKVGVGTTAANSGILIADSPAIRHPKIYLVVQEFFTQSRGFATRYYPEFEVINGVFTPGNGEALDTVSITGKPIIQAEAAFTDWDGNSVTRPWYGKFIISPYES